VKAFKNMQQNRIIHRDIKPQNILIHNQRIKIADFGFSKMVEDNNEAVKQTMLGNYSLQLLIKGTPLYLPLEILIGEKYSSKCDIFSTGIILYELIYGHHPFYHKKKLSGIPSLISELKNSKLQIPDTPQIKQSVKNLIMQMLATKEENRISWDELFVHPYFVEKEKN
jgi:serine/threonine protein kinase